MSNFKKNQVPPKQFSSKSKVPSKSSSNSIQFKTKAVFSHSKTLKNKKNEATQTKKWRYGPKMVTHTVTQTIQEHPNIKRVTIQAITIKIKKALLDFTDKQFDSDFSPHSGYPNFDGKQHTIDLFTAMNELEQHTMSTPFFEKKDKKEVFIKKLKNEFQPNMRTTWLGEIFEQLEPAILSVKELIRAVEFYATQF